MELIPLGILFLVALLIGQFLGLKDHQINKLKSEVRTLQAEKEILFNIIKDANRTDVAPKRLSSYEDHFGKKEN